MKKLFLFLMIILPTVLVAQNTIEVSGLKVEAGTVTFNVKWSDAGASNLWSDTVWVFVDYNKNGKMTRMLLEPGSTLTATSSPGVGELVEENIKGAWVVGDARSAGSFSATVQLLTATADLYGACAYASSYPPVGRHVSDTEIAFTGTPGYELKLLHTDGSTVETVESGSTFLLPCDYSMSSFTDATGAPGIKCFVPTGLSLTANYGTICNGQSATLTASATNVDYYSINGTAWQTSPVFKVSPTSNASYTLYAKTSDECSATLTNAATVAVTAIPPLPSLPTHNGPKCAGTGITFSATVPSGATGLDWTGSVSGTGTSKTTATTAGDYSAQVRSYLTAGTTCYSNWTASVSSTVNGPGGKDQSSTCGCTSGLGLTACNGYCRNLAADQAVCYNNYEVREICVDNDYAQNCPDWGGFIRHAYSRTETVSILTLIWNERNLGHTTWTGELGSGCRYVCTRTGCNTCTTGSSTSYGWLGRR
jgi:hypothetical protein